MAPTAFMGAVSMGLSPKPFMIVVTISAFTAFLTPVGTTTNAMVMGTGGYQIYGLCESRWAAFALVLCHYPARGPLFWPF